MANKSYYNHYCFSILFLQIYWRWFFQVYLKQDKFKVMALRKRLDVVVFRKKEKELLICWNDLKTHRFFFSALKEKIVKLKIIKFFCLLIKTAVAANGLDLQVMRKFLDKNGKIIVLGIKLYWKTFFTKF